jgi:hypothetical protein
MTGSGLVSTDAQTFRSVAKTESVHRAAFRSPGDRG